jgi:Ca2+-binding RTX toxin-like protein
MGTTIFGTSNVDVFVNAYTNFQYIVRGSEPDLSEPIDPSANLGNLIVLYVVTFNDITVSYVNSPTAVNIDLENSATFNGLNPYVNAAVQHGGYAEGDVLVDVSRVTGSIYDDVIRGSNPSDYAQLISVLDSKYPDFLNNTSEQSPFGLDAILHNPGNNILDGGNGNDLLEGRGGADTLNGGLGSDIASYETSPNFVIVQLPGASQAAIARGGDAEGDSFSSIEGLVGSRYNDNLTGNEIPNLLAGGLGSDVLNGMGGTDTADYSSDHFIFLPGDTADQVIVHLGLNGQPGTGQEFQLLSNPFGPPLPVQVSTDTLISIENVTGSNGNDTIVGNEVANVLDGRGGDDILDGGFGDDTLIGGTGLNTISYASHDVAAPAGEVSTITLGLNGGAGKYIRSDLVVIPTAHFQVMETDSLFGFQNVTGSNNAETINGNELANVLDGRGGNDTLDGGLGNDTIIGGPGINTVSYLSHDGLAPLPGEQDGVRLGLNGADGSFVRTELVSGGTQIVETDVLRGIQNVTGSNASEGILGNELDNTLSGRGGNDDLIGGAGNDTLLGGADGDVYDFTVAANGANNVGNDKISDDSGADAIVLDVHTHFSSARANNDLVLTLTSDATGTGAVGTIQVLDHFGTHPIEFLIVGNSVLSLATSMTGGNGNGIISGTERNDVMDGGGGDDLLFGNAGNDRMQGGTGNDRLFGGSGNDRLDGGPGDDVLNGGPGIIGCLAALEAIRSFSRLKCSPERPRVSPTRGPARTSSRTLRSVRTISI